jgi:hypothetical protein
MAAVGAVVRVRGLIMVAEGRARTYERRRILFRTRLNGGRSRDPRRATTLKGYAPLMTPFGVHGAHPRLRMRPGRPAARPGGPLGKCVSRDAERIINSNALHILYLKGTFVYKGCDAVAPSTVAVCSRRAATAQAREIGTL